MNKEEFTQRILAAELSLYRVAKSILHNDDDCADAIQNAILKAWQKRHALRKKEYFKTWLTRIVINECYQIIKESQRYIPMDEYPGWDILAADGIREESVVFAELMKLDEKYRMPIVLHDIEGYSVKEISKILHLTETNVRNRLSRGKAALRTQLEGEV